MSTVESREIGEILSRTREWPRHQRLALARQLLQELGSPEISTPAKSLNPEDVFGMLKTDAPPPDDEECRRIIEEERVKRHL